MSTGPDQLEAEARLWLGTPFAEGAAVRGAGCDCVGLMEALARAQGLVPPPRGTLSLEAGLAQVMAPRSGPPQPGDVLLLAREPGGAPVHAALLTTAGTLIHAHWSQGVVENRFGSWFQARLVAVFAWPAPPVEESKTPWQP